MAGTRSPDRTAHGRAACLADGGVRWSRLVAPEPGVAQALQLPLSITLCVAVFVLWALLTPLDAIVVDRTQLIEIAFALPPLHAVMRGMTMRGVAANGAGQGAASELARTNAARREGIGVSRRRYLATLALPLVALSIAPLILAAATGHTPGEMVACSLFNALASGGDALGAILVLTQVPAAATIRSNDAGILWRARAP